MIDRAGPAGPLVGLTVASPTDPARVEARVAAWLLGTLGAEVVPADRAADLVIAAPGPALSDLPGVPEGTAAYAVGVTLAAGALASVLGGPPVEVRPLDVAIQLFLPQVMAAAYGSPTWPVPPPPRDLGGRRGWLCLELGAPGEQERFDLFMAGVSAEATAPDVACGAQEWRLAVCDYRPRPASSAGLPDDGPVRPAGPAGLPATPTGAGPGGPPLDGITVCDLTAMWAGPLCTWLLGRLGATVWKVEPDVRPDGMRAFDGRGVHPDGRGSAPGTDSGLFQALNSGKARAPLDLRDAGHRRRLDDLVARSDLVVDSFSPRVMPNLGLTRDVLTADDPTRLTLSMPAFPPGPMRDWVAYGTGVHAVSGLGQMPSGVTPPFASPAVTYPDPLGGLTAATSALAGFVGRRRGWTPTHLEVPLQSAVLPLLALGAPSTRLADRDPGLGRRLLEEAGPEAMALVEVAGRDLPHPVGPFRGAHIPPPTGPAPAWTGCVR
ncbi:MAG TPA: CoA transferase [Acidimicrobiales bacterium]|nr:CoA transferase [Acidimicrobiales bacterium]